MSELSAVLTLAHRDLVKLLRDRTHIIFTGALAQTVWQSAALGVISLLMDREQDFSQEIFVSPISRYSIIFGKILGESLVALPQAVAIIVLGVILGVPFTPQVLAGIALA